MNTLTENELKNIVPEQNKLRVNYISTLRHRGKVEFHKHPLPEFVYYTSGSGIFTYKSEDSIHTFPFKTGTLCIIPPYVSHSEHSEEEYTNFHLTANYEKPISTSCIILQDSFDQFLHLFTNINRIYHERGHNYPALLNSYLDVLSNTVISLMNATPKNEIVEQIEHAILDHLSDTDFRIKQVLDSLPYSNEYARQSFVKATGVTPQQYLIEKRINLAKQILRTKNSNGLTIKVIADYCGFSDSLYFSRIFKQHVGLSPKDFSQQNEIRDGS